MMHTLACRRILISPSLHPGQHDPQPKRTDYLSPLLHISERESMTLES